MGIQENLEKFRSAIPANVKIVAVSKTKPGEAILEAYHAGHKIFGENKAQELIQKQPQLPSDIQWHFIGHLQSNKVKYIAPFVEMIHSVDSLKLLKEINKQAVKNNRLIKCLLQFHIASEETKFGLDYEEAIEILKSESYETMENVKIVGVMGMATFTDENETVRNEFRNLKSLFERLRTDYFSEEPDFKEISMGMSDDYRIAIEEGSSLVRIGSAIFGARHYHA